MAREFGPVNVEIWTDPDWRNLPPAAQHLYLTLWTSPGLSYCGVHDWRPGRLANRSCGFTSEHVAMVGDCLAARHFLVIDEETEEVLIRSWARFDGLLKQPRMAVSYANAYAQVDSPILRAVLVHETAKIREKMPDLACWRDKRVASLLEHPATSAKDLDTPEDPFGDVLGGSLALGLAQTPPRVSPRVSTGPTPAPTPAPSSSTPKDTAPRKRGTRIDDGFAVNDEMRAWAVENVPLVADDLDAATAEFVDYWRAIPGSRGTKLDWVATWRNRMRDVSERRERIRPIRRESSGTGEAAIWRQAGLTP